MVRRIEALETELQILAFRNMEILDGRSIEVEQTRSNQCVPARGTERTGGLRHKRWSSRTVQPTVTRGSSPCRGSAVVEVVLRRLQIIR